MRALLCPLLGLLLFVGPFGVARAEPELPLKTALKPFKLKAPLRWAYPMPEGRGAADVPAVLVAKIGRRSLLLADVDGNGTFDEPGADGWCLKGATYLVPLQSPFVIGSSRVRLHADPEKKVLRYALEPIEASPLVLRCLEGINARRMQNGLPPGDIDPELSEGCRLHSLYCDRHGVGHSERPGAPGYSEAGAAAGRSSAVGGGGLATMDQIYGQFFHRFTLTDPRTAVFGLGHGRQCSCVDGMQGRRARPWTWPVAIPAPGSQDQPLAFDQHERPLAYPAGMSPGFPITLQFRDQGEFSDVTAVLHREGKPTKPLKIIVKWPGNPASPRFPRNYNAIVVIPEFALTRNTTYAVTISYKLDGRAEKHSWTFRTVASR